MTVRYQFVLTPLDVALADARTQRRHFLSIMLMPGAITCRVCGVILTADEWSADTGYCPGPGERGLDPVLVQRISIGPVSEEDK